MAFTPKTDWKDGDLLPAADVNRIEQGIADASKPVSYSDLTDKPNLLQIGTTATTAAAGNHTHEGLMTVSERNKLAEINPSAYATKTDIKDFVTDAEVADKINDIPAPDLSSYATQDYVTNAINQAVIDGSGAVPDLSAYALQTEVDGKVDAVAGKGLSTNDFTNVLKTKLDGIEAGAQVNPDLSGYATVNSVQNLADSQIKYYDNDGLKTYTKCAKILAQAKSGNVTWDFSHVGFASPPDVWGIFSRNTSSELSGRTFGGWSVDSVTTTTAKGTLAGATVAGLIVNTMAQADGPVYIVLMGN